MSALYNFDSDVSDLDPIYECDLHLEAARRYITQAIAGDVDRHRGIEWAHIELDAARSFIKGIQA